MINNTTVTFEYSNEYPIGDYDVGSYETKYDASSAEIVSLARENPGWISSDTLKRYEVESIDDLDDDELFDAAIDDDGFMELARDYFEDSAE